MCLQRLCPCEFAQANLHSNLDGSPHVPSVLVFGTTWLHATRQAFNSCCKQPPPLPGLALDTTCACRAGVHERLRRRPSSANSVGTPPHTCWLLATPTAVPMAATPPTCYHPLPPNNLPAGAHVRLCRQDASFPHPSSSYRNPPPPRALSISS